MDSFTDHSATPSYSSGVAVCKQKSIAAKSEAEVENKIALAGIECAMERLKNFQQPNPPVDDFHIFGMFVASELRLLKDPAYAKTGQRKINRLFLDIMENEPVK